MSDLDRDGRDEVPGLPEGGWRDGGGTEMSRSVTYGLRDVGDGDTLIRTADLGYLIRNGDTDLYLRFNGVFEYAGWVDRNAEHLGDPQEFRRFARALKELFGPKPDVAKPPSVADVAPPYYRDDGEAGA